MVNGVVIDEHHDGTVSVLGIYPGSDDKRQIHAAVGKGIAYVVKATDLAHSNHPWLSTTIRVIDGDFFLICD